MSKEKQSRADLADKKIQALIQVVQRILDENAHLKDLAVGTLETIKLMLIGISMVSLAIYLLLNVFL